MPSSLPPRADVDKRYTWDAESVFPEPADWEQAVDTILSSLPDLGEFEGHLGDSPESLADWFDANERAHRLLAKVVVYTTMSYSVDVGNQEAAARSDRARSVAAQLGAAAAFAVPEMLEIGLPRLQHLFQCFPLIRLTLASLSPSYLKHCVRTSKCWQTRLIDGPGGVNKWQQL